MNDTEIDDLVNELQNSENEIKKIKTESPSISAENINEYILNTSAEIVNNGMQTLEILQQRLLTCGEETLTDSYSKLLTSVVKAVETINKINIQQIKDKTTKEVKKMEMDSKEKMTNQISHNSKKQISGGNTTNVIVATREDFFKMVKEMDTPEEMSMIDVEDENDKD